MTKKSFFERLTGVTKEEALKSVPKEKINLEKLNQPEAKIKKTKLPETSIEEKPKAQTPAKEDWLPEEEGQLTIDVYQTDADIVVKSTIAGVKSEDLDVSITNDMITIKGLRRQEGIIPQENYYYQELYWGPFSRSIILPTDVDADKARASLKDGILTVHLPKTEKVKTKIIKVKETE